MDLFASPPEHYDRLVGRYSDSLGAALIDAAGVAEGKRVLDVGCGPGALTSELTRRLGAENVAAIDPAAQFVEECRRRNPGADVREGDAEELPWAVDEFDSTLSCLVIAYMKDPEKGVGEMVRVTRPGGTVASCMWDFAEGGMTMLRMFWSAVRELKPDLEGTGPSTGTGRGDIAGLFDRAGLREIVEDLLKISAEYSDFDDFWTPFTLGVGSSGAALSALSEEQQEVVRDTCRAALPDGPFSLDARAWFARGTAPG